MNYEAALAALAHPTRRRLMARLRRRPHTVGELARVVHVSQPGASQHLKVLRRARLVTERRDGVRRFYRASPEGLAALRQYVESMWDDVLKAYAQPESESRRRGEPK